MVAEEWLEANGYPTECPDCGGDIELVSGTYVKGVECTDCDYELTEGI